MTEKFSFDSFFNEVATSASFDRLKEFPPEKYSSLQEHEKELLAKLFVLQADALLEDAVKSAKEKRANQEDVSVCFDPVMAALLQAKELCPHNPNVWYRYAVCCDLRGNVEDFKEACLSFKQAAHLEPNNFDIHFSLATSLMRLGVHYEEAEYLYEALQSCEYAESLLKKSGSEENIPLREKFDFYWQWGLIGYFTGKTSGEPCDYQTAIGAFRKAEELAKKNAGLLEHTETFYDDFASTLLEFAKLVKRDDLFYEAISLYDNFIPAFEKSLHAADKSSDEKEVTNLEKGLASACFHMGSCYANLFYKTHQKTQFDKACQYFQKAYSINPNIIGLYIEGGKVFFVAARVWQDAHLLRSAIEKFTTSLEREELPVELYGQLAEALALLGSHEDRVDLVQDAKDLLIATLKDDEELPELWASLCFTLSTIGRYFVDEKYFTQAIEAAQKGLQHTDTVGTLFHYLGVAKFSLAELNGDLALMQEANSHYEEAAKLEPGTYGYFWNEWGILLLSLSELSRDKTYLKGSEEKFAKAVSMVDAPQAEWLFNWGCTLDFLGDLQDEPAYYEKAIANLQRAYFLDPTFPSICLHLASAYAHLAEVTEDLEAFEKADTTFKEAAEEDNEDDLVWSEWGAMLLNMYELVHDNVLKTDRELLSRAEQCFLKAQALGGLTACYSLACTYCLQGNLQEAMHYFEKAMESSMPPPMEVVFEEEWLEPLRRTSSFQDYIESRPKEI
jgi:tetratricopeptide (TPR) repeat protein